MEDQILVEILRDVSSQCDKCKIEVASRLAEVTGRVEVISVD